MSIPSVTAAADLPASGFVRLPQIIGSEHQPGVFPVSKSHFYAGIRRGLFPAPVKFGRVSAWRVEDIRALLERGAKAA